MLKRRGERFTGYSQVLMRSGGRNGVALSVGFRWAIGEEYQPNYMQKEVKSINDKVFDDTNIIEKPSIEKITVTKKNVDNKNDKKLKSLKTKKNDFQLKQSDVALDKINMTIFDFDYI